MKVLVIIGTRPEAIKMAPVVQELLRRPERFETRVCLTGQHRELLDQVIRLFQLPVHYDLNVMLPGQLLGTLSGAILKGMTEVLQQWRPDTALVHGDTTTSFAAALACFYEKVPVGHVEAGLRTYERYAPFPEEMNRRLCDVLCTYHYAPTASARENLLRENISPQHILVTGNTVIDALLQTAAEPCEAGEANFTRAGADSRLLLVTAHRRESFGAAFQEMCGAIAAIVEGYDDLEVVYPVHPNPQVRAAVERLLSGHPRIHLIAPLEYRPFVHLLKQCHLVLTDSGGIQEEAPALGKPVLVMREVTERPEAVAAGAVQLVGTQHDAIVSAVQRLLEDPARYEKMSCAGSPYGDGHAAQRIVDHLASLSG